MRLPDGNSVGVTPRSICCDNNSGQYTELCGWAYSAVVFFFLSVSIRWCVYCFERVSLVCVSVLWL